VLKKDDGMAEGTRFMTTDPSQPGRRSNRLLITLSMTCSLIMESMSSRAGFLRLVFWRVGTLTTRSHSRWVRRLEQDIGENAMQDQNKVNDVGGQNFSRRGANS